ncbi:hypothetical protein [Microvirga sp. 2TAF3]|uniref:hypothetical protein n=1 Tax=Microvirga sp. 2TAF3 TaxID=3233014 RepID=UPI003F9E320F
MSLSPSFHRELLGARRAFAIAQLELRSLRIALAHKLFNPNQPRVPAGSPNGGQWVGEGDSGGEARVETVNLRSRRQGGGTRVIQGRVYETTPGQELRLAESEARAGALVRAVQSRDPRWRPSPSIYEGVEGEILANESNALQAAVRLRELQVREPICRPAGDAIVPNGQWIGAREGRATIGTRTVPTSEFKELLEAVLPGAQVVQSPVGYQGRWYRQPDGSVFGIRWSEQHGVTFDIIRSNNPLVRNGDKVHQK